MSQESLKAAVKTNNNTRVQQENAEELAKRKAEESQEYQPVSAGSGAR